MQHTFTAIYLHVVFAVYERQALLTSTWRGRVHAYLASICRNHEVDVYAIGGVGDHVHLAIAIKSSVNIPDLLRDLKSNSSRFIRDNFNRRFAWQRGYAAFSVSPSGLPRLVRYIERQEAHHVRTSSTDELKKLLESYGVSTSR